MLKIRSDAWHYRLWKMGHENKFARPTNLCRYFWFLFFIITIPIILSILAIIGIIALLWVMYSNPETTAVVIGVIVAFAVLIVVSVYFAKRADEKQKEEVARLKAEGNWPPPAKEPNVFMAWFSAKKQKICPLISIEEVRD